MKEKLIIVGTSTTAHQAYDFVKYHGLYDVVGFAVDREYYKESEFMGMPVYELEKLDELEEKEVYVPQKKDLTVLLAELEEIKNSIDDIKAKQWHLAKLMQFHQKGLANE